MDPSAAEALREDAKAIFLAAVAAADPREAVRRAIRAGGGGSVMLAGREIAPPSLVRVVAVGKAGCAMAEAAASALSPRIFPGPGIAVVNDENARPVERFTVLAAGHPVPDERGAGAALAVERLAGSAREGDGLLVLISGGGSALLPAPAEGLTLEDKARVTTLLLGSGGDIRELNAVRKHLSRLKGGLLARRAQPAVVESLILSDVIGDDPSSIASGPTAPDPTTFRDAMDILARRGVWELAPDPVRTRIEAGAGARVPETPKPGHPLFDRVENRIIGGNGISLAAAAAKARSLGYEVDVLPAPLEGEARAAGASLAARAGPAPPGIRRAILAGGETTVTLRGAGKGGRNQEMALAFAIAGEGPLAGFPWAFLSGGTDGRDGPTDAAGGLVGPGSLERARRAGIDPERALAENDSYRFHEAAGTLLVTGGTGTNVADIQVALVG